VRNGASSLFGRPTAFYQGLSLAFDPSVEEMWLAFNAGATLVAATREMMQSGPDLARHLRAARVTVVSTRTDVVVDARRRHSDVAAAHLRR